MNRFEGIFHEIVEQWYSTHCPWLSAFLILIALYHNYSSQIKRYGFPAQEKEEFLIDAEHVGRLVGKGGSNIRRTIAGSCWIHLGN